MKYADRCLYGRRSYELRAAAIFASGTNMNGTRFEVTLPYSELNPIPDKIWLRSPLLWGGVALLGLAGVCFAFRNVFIPAELCIGMLIAGGVITLASLRKIELARFKSASGVPLLDIFKAGPMKDQFDHFITELQNRIQQQKSP